MSNDDDVREDGGGGESSPVPIFIIFGVLFFPSVIIAFCLYGMLRIGRQQKSVVNLAALIVLIVAGILGIILSPISNVLNYFSGVYGYGNFMALLPFYTVINMVLGAIGGMIITSLEVKNMEANPHRFQIEGNWMYGFKYKPTPWEKAKRKKIISDLKAGNLHDDEKAPLGVTMTGEPLPVYRYNSEARTHSIITGASGSGKPLAGNTLIPTPNGFVMIKDLKDNDYVFDEKGEKTLVEAIFHPKINEAYEMNFNNGENIISGDEHLWLVNDLTNGESKIISSEEIFKGFKNGIKYSINYVQKPVDYTGDTLSPSPEILVKSLIEDFNNSTDSTGTIPDNYKYSAIEDRVKLIESFTRGCGTIDDDVVAITLKSKNIIKDLYIMVSSLGWKVNPIKNDGEDYCLSFIRNSVEDNSNSSNMRTHLLEDIKISNYDKSDFYCITVAAESHLFLVGEGFIPTRNTITLQSLILNDIIAGIPVILIDLKRSPEFASKLAAWTKRYNGTFYHFVNGSPADYDVKDSPGQAYYDVLKGSPTTKSDMMLGLRDWDTASEVYRANMQQLLTVVFAMLHYADRSKTKKIKWNQGGIKQLESALDINNFMELAIACEGTEIENDANQVLEKLQSKTQLLTALVEMQGQVRTIAASEYGQWLTSAENALNIDLFKLTRKPGTVILFSINSDSEPKFAKLIGSMIMSDLTNVSARRRNKQIKNQVNIYVDEFQALNASSVSSILEKSRESAMSMTLAQQSFEQVVASSSEAHLLSILDTCSNFIIHAGSTEDSALRLSKILGKKDVTVYTASNKNDSSFLKRNKKNRQSQNIMTSTQEKWIVSPKEFMSLRSPRPHQGDFLTTAVVINKSVADPHYSHHSGALARKVEMIPDSEILETYYIPNFKDDEEHDESGAVEFDGGEEELFDSDNAIPTPDNTDYMELYKSKKIDGAEGGATKVAPRNKPKRPQNSPAPLRTSEDEDSHVINLDKDDDEGGFGWVNDNDSNDDGPPSKGISAFNAEEARNNNSSNRAAHENTIQRSKKSSFDKITETYRSTSENNSSNSRNNVTTPKKRPTKVSNKPVDIDVGFKPQSGGNNSSSKNNHLDDESFTLPSMDDIL